SEAIDAARWAATSTFALDELADRCEPLGVVLVAGPWNFPYAIPTNGVVGALAAGNAAIFKPAPEAVATATALVRHLHEGGVPDDVVQLVSCPEDEVGQHLVTHDGIDTVLLTGAFETARLFQSWKPSLRLIAETSGKNAMVITAAADHDLAIKDLLRSAFGHAGQKCSAASLAILEGAIHDDDRFLRRLADAVRSLRVGQATDLATMVGPLIRPPGAALKRALTELDEGERWLVAPAARSATEWTPGVKLGVRMGSWFHQTECFGPVLGVMRARDLDHAIELQNATPYGLTGGIHSLDPVEVERWLARVEVGNAYVNRHITGAIVRRQPFGGWKASAVGPGAKTGGPGDILRFVRFRPSVAADTYQSSWDRTFGVATDATGLRSEQNLLRYRPVAKVICRPDPTTSEAELDLLRRAASLTGVPLELCGADEDDPTFALRLATSGAERLRLLTSASDVVLRAAHDLNIRVDDTPVTGDGRIELPCWLREQAISLTLHRHGRVSSPPT
ncbi:MAG: aldehyde dehydrogenase family protein, partial [Acidimicrobiales bacterium]